MSECNDKKKDNPQEKRDKENYEKRKDNPDGKKVFRPGEGVDSGKKGK